ncbi:hypothetical protein OXX69_002638 [Metschnikowia pulcherrima]
MGKIWQVSFLFGLILKSTLGCAHRILGKYSAMGKVPISDSISKESGQNLSSTIIKPYQNRMFSIHPSTSRFSWQVSGSHVICVPVNLEPATTDSLSYSSGKIASDVPAGTILAKEAYEKAKKEIDLLTVELFSTVIHEFSHPIAGRTTH